MIHHFSTDDWELARQVAVARHRTESAREDADLIGALGEVAFSRLFTMHDPYTNYALDGGWDYEMPDGVTVDVKTITEPTNSLLVPKMGRAGIYVLCLVDYEDQAARFLGVITGGKGKSVGTIAPWGKHYMIEQKHLASFDSWAERYLDG